MYPRPRRWPLSRPGEEAILKYLRTTLNFGQCPRCGGMANVAEGEQLNAVVHCPSCLLSACPPIMTIWGEVLRCELHSDKPMLTIADGIERIKRSGAAGQVWIGDVLVASWSPKGGTWCHNGHCREG